jgi:hypothetical protein
VAGINSDHFVSTFDDPDEIIVILGGSFFFAGGILKLVTFLEIF